MEENIVVIENKAYFMEDEKTSQKVNGAYKQILQAIKDTSENMMLDGSDKDIAAVALALYRVVSHLKKKTIRTFPEETLKDTLKLIPLIKWDDATKKMREGAKISNIHFPDGVYLCMISGVVFTSGSNGTQIYYGDELLTNKVEWYVVDEEDTENLLSRRQERNNYDY